MNATRPTTCPDCGASCTSHTGSYCQKCGSSLFPVKPQRPPIRDKHFDYCERRLLAPTGDVLDVVERLRRIGHDDMAERLMVAAQAFVDVCRDVRGELADRNRARLAVTR